MSKEIQTNVFTHQAVIKEEGEIGAKNIPLNENELKEVASDKAAGSPTVFIRGEEYRAKDVLIKKTSSMQDEGDGKQYRFYIRTALIGVINVGGVEEAWYRLEQRETTGLAPDNDNLLAMYYATWDRDKRAWRLTDRNQNFTGKYLRDA